MLKLLRLSLALTLLLAVAGVVPAAGQDQTGPEPIPQTPSLENPIYMPFMMKTYQGFSVTGQVTDETGNPLTGVVVSSGAGLTTTTDLNGSYVMSVGKGEYSVAAQQNNFGFLPPNMDLSVQSNITSLDFTGTDCTELVVNGGFDTDDSWVLSNAAFGDVISGTRSLKLGLVDPASNAAGSSAAMSNVFTIPSTAKDPMLRLWIFTRSVGAAKPTAPSEPKLGEIFFGPALDANDHQAIQILNSDGTLLETLKDFGGSNNQEWGLVQYNLAKYVGNTIRLGLGVTNDGLGGVTAMFVDSVSLVTCPTVYAPEGLDPSALLSSPDACANQLGNPGFETSGGWHIPYTEFPAGYTTAVYPGTVFAGARSMRTGIPVYQPWNNRYSYSDFWQVVYIPNAISSASLDVWVKLTSTEAPYAPEGAPEGTPEVDLAETDPAFAPGKTWGQEPLAYDAMYIMILNPYNGYVIQTLKSWPAKNNDWKHWVFDLSAYHGLNIRIQMGSYNDGWQGVTAMYVDEAQVIVCDGGLPPPPPPPPATTCGAGQTEQLVNTSFETNNGWYRPVTAYTAHYSNLLFYTGARSMQTGIINWWHNRYSYSDFGQYVYIPSGVSNATLRYWVNLSSGGGGWGRDWYDKQYLLVLNPWGYWIDTLFWANGRNSAGWVNVVQDITYMRGYPVRLQFGTYNNGWNGVSSMFVDDVTLCTTP
jgi:hypothetical protein